MSGFLYSSPPRLNSPDELLRWAEDLVRYLQSEQLNGLPSASTDQLGLVTIDGTSIVQNALGQLSVAASVGELFPATTSTLGGVIIGSGISVDPSGVISVSGGSSSAIPGPYADNAAALAAGVPLYHPYYDSSGAVFAALPVTGALLRQSGGYVIRQNGGHVLL